MKNFFFKFKAFPEKPFFSKKSVFRFCQKFGFIFEKLSNHYSQLKKQVKVDPETRSYDIRAKTQQKIPTIPNMAILWTTLGNGMIMKKSIFFSLVIQNIAKKKAHIFEMIVVCFSFTNTESVFRFPDVTPGNMRSLTFP